MIYYIKLNPELDTLEMKEVKNIHGLSLATKINWSEINNFMNGTDNPIDWLGSCMMPFPYIKRNGDMYYFSYFKDIIKDRNYPGMSKEVLEELQFMNQFQDITATSRRHKVN